MKPYCSHLKHKKFDCCNFCDGLDTDCRDYKIDFRNHSLRQDKRLESAINIITHPADRQMDYEIIRMYKDTGVI